MAARVSSEDSGPSTRLNSFDEISDSEQAKLLELDVERQDPVFSAGTKVEPVLHHEDTIPMRTKLIALAGYFICNIGLTLYNKAILGPFRFPYLLTALHAGCSSIGCLIMLQAGVFRLSKLGRREHLVLIAFSFLFTINIAVSNVSLAMVSVPFHQLVRATTPLFTTTLFRLLYGRTYSRETYLSLVPIVLGVILATSGELSFSDLGFITTLLGVILAALKTIATNRIMTGSLALSFWEVLIRMSPLACLQSIFYAAVTGELGSFLDFFRGQVLSGEPDRTWSPWTFALIMLGNGILAFALNVSSFSTNKVAGALTMTVCANIKQCLTIILGGILFHVDVTATNVGGVLVTVCGGAMYSYVELDSKRKKAKAQEAQAQAQAAARGTLPRP